MRAVLLLGWLQFVVLLCERPPTCMPFSCTNLLLSLFTANKGDNYVMSTFRRLEVGVAICLCVSAEIKSHFNLKAVRLCRNVSAVKHCVVVWCWLQVNGIPEERKVAEALNLWPETPLSTFYSISIFLFFSNICANLHASEVSLQRFIVHMHLHLQDSAEEQQSLADYKTHENILKYLCRCSNYVCISTCFAQWTSKREREFYNGNASVVMLLCVLCHMRIIKTYCQYFHRTQWRLNDMKDLFPKKKEAKPAHFMKLLLTMYNRIKAFINNMDTFHIFKTSQKDLHVTYLKEALHRGINSCCFYTTEIY